MAPRRDDSDRYEWPDEDALERSRRRSDDRAFNESLSRARRPSRVEESFDSAVEGEYEVADEPRSGRRHR